MASHVIALYSLNTGIDMNELSSLISSPAIRNLVFPWEVGGGRGGGGPYQPGKGRDHCEQNSVHSSQACSALEWIRMPAGYHFELFRSNIV